MTESATIEALLAEGRTFPPPDDFKKTAHVVGTEIYDEADRDGAKRDEDGYFWLLGRVDDVMLVSGHNISTAEVEHALVGHSAVAEAAVIGRTDKTTGQAISAFVILRAGNDPGDALASELREHVSETIGPIAKPKSILFTDDLPKTRSGKIMRRLLRNVAEDEQLGDTTTLADPSVVEGIKSRYLDTAAAEE
jgi:acetyl-CoA synthetase